MGATSTRNGFLHIVQSGYSNQHIFGINSHQLVSKGYRVTNGTGSSDLWCWDGNGEFFRFSLEIRSSFRPPF